MLCLRILLLSNLPRHNRTQSSLLPHVLCDCSRFTLPALQLLRSYMDTAVANNLNVMRIWAQTVGFNRAPFQTSPGVYNENIFRGIDYTLDQARQRNLKVRHEPFLHLTKL